MLSKQKIRNFIKAIQIALNIWLIKLFLDYLFLGLKVFLWLMRRIWDTGAGFGEVGLRGTGCTAKRANFARAIVTSFR